jgi:hypothetical protein
MQTLTLFFIETMRGQVVMTDRMDEEYSISLLSMPEQKSAQIITKRFQAGGQQGQTRPMVWQDLAIAVQNKPIDGAGGLAGVINAGAIRIDGLATEPLVIKQGKFSLLSITAQGERCMRYQLDCQARDGQRFLLYGFKCISNSRGRLLPLTVWRETTTLYVVICALGEQGAPTALVATGMMHIHPLDLLKQLLTLRSRGVAGQLAHLRNLASFGRFFTAGLVEVYWKK